MLSQLLYSTVMMMIVSQTMATLAGETTYVEKTIRTQQQEMQEQPREPRKIGQAVAVFKTTG